MDDTREHEPAALDVTLRPYRSLSAAGFVILMAVIGLAGCATAVAFFLIGAWPVPGFIGLDVALIYLAFRVNYRRARAWERVTLTRATLTVERGAPGRETKSFTFQPYWLRVEVDHAKRLLIASHGKRFEIGAFLHPAERRKFGEALRAALAKQKSAI
jgi:uncharacterized membrane protein